MSDGGARGVFAKKVPTAHQLGCVESHEPEKSARDAREDLFTEQYSPPVSARPRARGLNLLK